MSCAKEQLDHLIGSVKNVAVALEALQSGKLEPGSGPANVAVQWTEDLLSKAESWLQSIKEGHLDEQVTALKEALEASEQHGEELQRQLDKCQQTFEERLEQSSSRKARELFLAEKEKFAQEHLAQAEQGAEKESLPESHERPEASSLEPTAGPEGPAGLKRGFGFFADPVIRPSLGRRRRLVPRPPPSE